jgi:hypothetical protein
LCGWLDFKPIGRNVQKKKMKISFLIVSICILTVVAAYGQQKVYYNQTELGAMFGETEDNWNGESETRVNFSMITFHGVRFSKYHAVGFSLGLDHYKTIDIIPFALGWRGFLGEIGKPQMIGGLDIGGGSTILGEKVETEWGKSWYEGGVMASPSVGVFLPGRKGRTTLTFTFAYKLQKFSLFNGSFDRVNPTSLASSLPPGYGSLTENSYSLQSLVVRMGLSF